MALFFLVAGRVHGDVLGQAWPVAEILAIAVRQQAVPDHQITRLAPDRFAFITGEIGPVWMAVNGLGFDPFGENVVKAGDAVKATLVGIGVGEIEHALDKEGRWILRGIDVPVGKTLVAPARSIRRVHAHAVETGPEFFGVPDVGKGTVDAFGLAVVPHRLVVIDLDHTIALALRRVPRFRVVGVHFEKGPERVDDFGQVFWGDGVGDDDITIFLPEGEVGWGEGVHWVWLLVVE